MTRRSFTVIDVVEILVHWHAGRSKAEIARSLDIDRGTVRKYTARAVQEGFRPAPDGPSRAEWAALVQDWFPEVIDPRARSLTYSLIAPFQPVIKEMLTTNTVTTVHQRLRDEQGLSVSLTSFRRYVWLELPEEAKRAEATVPRPEVPPGDEAQIDYGYLGRYFDTALDRWRRVWAFVFVLAYSRHMFVRPVVSMDQRQWTACHVRAFEFFGAVPRRLVCDNLATGVLKADIYDPRLNRSYAELAEHYGCLVDPARRAKPKDKPRVERQMPYVRDSLFAGREWHSAGQLVEAGERWCLEVAGVRQHRSLEGATPLALYEAVEREAMLPRPQGEFELASWSRPMVGRDCFAKASGKALYTVPFEHIGQVIDAREGDCRVEFFKDGKLIKSWARIESGRQIDWDDFPPEKVAFYMQTPQWCLTKAGELGEKVHELVLELLAEHAMYNLRSVQGVLRLAERHGAERLDQACGRALQVGDARYRTVKGILAAGTERDGEEELPAPEAPAHLHGQQALFSSEEVAE
jgi:transposase